MKELQTLFKSYDNWQAAAKKAEYERRTGIKWDVYHNGDGYVIHPTATSRSATRDEQAANAVRPFIDRRHKLLSTTQAQSGLPWQMVVDGCWTLIQARQVRYEVNRNGLIATVYVH